MGSTVVWIVKKNVLRLTGCWHVVYRLQELWEILWNKIVWTVSATFVLSFYSLSKRWNKGREKITKRLRFLGVVLFCNGITGRRKDEDFLKETRERERSLDVQTFHTRKERKGYLLSYMYLSISFHYFFSTAIWAAIIPTLTLLLWAQYGWLVVLCS